MKFFFPDSQDMVDPSFDFEIETRSATRVRHRDDRYAHEVFGSPPFDGILVSKAIIDGSTVNGAKYTFAQKQRLLRVGVREFFRLDEIGGPKLHTMGDCGAFAYAREKTPPFTVEEVLDYYAECRFDLGLSVDHVILPFQPAWDDLGGESGVPPEIRFRQDLTLDLAREFLGMHKGRGDRFEPVGVAQGWSPLSYAKAVSELQKMGYTYIALGGMVPLKTNEILSCLEAISRVKSQRTRFHLLGVTRINQVSAFSDYGVVSFDSTSPLRQAFKDDKDNYYTMDRAYVAIRIPQVEANPSLKKRIRAGLVRQDEARVLEKLCLERMKGYDSGVLSIDKVLEALGEYENLYDPKRDNIEAYREVLEAQPWKECACEVCEALGYHVILFRGAERNRRRGFHNLWTFHKRLNRRLDTDPIRENSLFAPH